jgi:hypothetical protein
MLRSDLMRNGIEGLKILGAYLGGAAMALALMALFYGLPVEVPLGGHSVVLLSTGAVAATGALARTKRPGESVLFSISGVAVLGVAFVCAVHATVGWKDGPLAPVGFALLGAVLMPLAHAWGERRRTMPGAILERPVGGDRA